MEILSIKNIKYLVALLALIIILALAITSRTYISNNKIKSYFDIYLANNYNNLNQDNKESNYKFLSDIKDQNISFFADLKLSSLGGISKYDDFEKNLILLKYSIINKDYTQLKSLSSGQFFKQTARIYYLNANLNSSINDQDQTNNNDFFSNAIQLYLNDN